MSLQHTKILVHTPAFVQNSQHVAMIGVQAQLVPRLRIYFPPEIELVSALIVDHCATEDRAALEQVASRFDIVKWSIPDRHGTDWGIRKGTNYAVTEVADEAGATHVLRVIQDTFVFDTIALSQLIREAVAIPGSWICAKIDYWESGYHAGLCEQMGLACVSQLRYSQGAVMFCPVATWRKWYVSLPANINHYFDDVMMSEAFRQRRGGLQIDWTPCWSHRHNLDEVTSNRVAAAHKASIKWNPEESPLATPTTEPAVRLGVCAVARNEEAYIGEWLEFHRLVGVDRFWIYADDTWNSPMRREILRRNRGDVVLIPWPRNDGSPQMTAYNHFMENFGSEARWVAFIDVDEFLFSPTGLDVSTILKTYEDIAYHGGVFVNWLVYGDSGHLTQPSGLTIENYTLRGIAGNPDSRGKLILRMKLSPRFSTDPFQAVYEQDGLTINEHRSWVPGAESPPSIDLLRLNHYFHRSQEESERKWKSRKGHGFPKLDADDMARHNLNDIEDTVIWRYLPALRDAMSNPP